MGTKWVPSTYKHPILADTRMRESRAGSTVFSFIHRDIVPFIAVYCGVPSCGEVGQIRFPSKMSSVRVRSPAPRKASYGNETGHLLRWPVSCPTANVYQMCTVLGQPVASSVGSLPDSLMG